MMKLIHWFMVDRWYFKEFLKEQNCQDDYVTLWRNIKLTRPDGIIRRDIGRMIIKQSGKAI